MQQYSWEYYACECRVQQDILTISMKYCLCTMQKPAVDLLEQMSAEWGRGSGRRRQPVNECACIGQSGAVGL